MEHSWEALVPIMFFLVVAWIIKISLEHRTRQRLIEKGLVDENVKFLYADKLARNGQSSLKWGLVSVAVGIAVLIGMQYGDEDGKLTIGAMFTLAGLALIIHYFIASHLSKKPDEQIQK